MGIDYSDLDDIPGTIPKPKKREKKPKEPKPRKPLPKRNERRAKETHAEAYGPQSEACRAIGICCCCGRTGKTEPHHLKTVRAGGTDEWTVPMLHECHMRAHSRGRITFWAEVGINPLEIRDGMREWVAAGCPQHQLPVRKK